ncbi:hypothetical protein GJ496_010912 [Pomphorhynchus laevis]|nr:hypothetical protein GJ496_010912 [Pomphorhynchus laevis]
MYRNVTSDIHLIEERKNLKSALHDLPIDVARKCSSPVIEYLAQSLVNRITSLDEEDFISISAHTTNWLLDCLAFNVQDIHDFLKIDADKTLTSIKYCVNIYSEWLSPLHETVEYDHKEQISMMMPLMSIQRRQIPDTIRSNIDYYSPILLWHLFYIFNQQQTEEDDSENFSKCQSFYCKRVLRLLECIVFQRNTKLSSVNQLNIHKEILLLTIAVADMVLSRYQLFPNDIFLCKLVPSLSQSVFKIWMKSTEQGMMLLSIWKSLYMLSDRWIDVTEVMYNWSITVIELTRQLISNDDDEPLVAPIAIASIAGTRSNFLLQNYDKEDKRRQISLSTFGQLYTSWYKFLFMFADPVGSIKLEDNIINFLNVIDQVTSTLSDYSSLNSIFHLFSHWIFKVSFSKAFHKGRSSAIRLLYSLVTSRCSARLAKDYVLRLIYLTYDILDPKCTDVLSVFISYSDSFYRLHNIPTFMVTVPRLVYCLNVVSDDFVEKNRTGCINAVTSAFPFLYHWNLPKSDRNELHKLCERLLQTETNPIMFRTLLCVQRLIDISESNEASVLTNEDHICSIVCNSMLTNWIDNYAISVNCIQYLSLRADPLMNSAISEMCVLSLCKFIRTQLNKEPFKHVRQMHTAVVLAFDCLCVYLKSHLLKSSNILRPLAEVINLGMVGHRTLGSAYSTITSNIAANETKEDKRPASRRVEQAAYRLLDWFVNGDERFTSVRKVPAGNGFAQGKNHILTINTSSNIIDICTITSHASSGTTEWTCTACNKGRTFSAASRFCDVDKICKVSVLNNSETTNDDKINVVSDDSIIAVPFTQEVDNARAIYEKELNSFRLCIGGSCCQLKHQCVNEVNDRVNESIMFADTLKCNSPPNNINSLLKKATLKANKVQRSFYHNVDVTNNLLAQLNKNFFPNQFLKDVNYFRKIQILDRVKLPATSPTGICSIFYVRADSQLTMDFRGDEFLHNSRLDKRFFNLIKSLGKLKFLHDEDLQRISLREVDGILSYMYNRTRQCILKFIVSPDWMINARSNVSSDNIRGMSKNSSSSIPATTCLAIIYFESIQDMKLFSEQFKRLCNIAFLNYGLNGGAIGGGGSKTNNIDMPLENDILLHPKILAKCLQELAEMICLRESMEVNESNSGYAERRIQIQKWMYHNCASNVPATQISYGSVESSSSV